MQCVVLSNPAMNLWWECSLFRSMIAGCVKLLEGWKLAASVSFWTFMPFNPAKDDHTYLGTAGILILVLKLFVICPRLIMFVGSLYRYDTILPVMCSHGYSSKLGMDCTLLLVLFWTRPCIYSALTISMSQSYKSFNKRRDLPLSSELPPWYKYQRSETQ